MASWCALLPAPEAEEGLRFRVFSGFKVWVFTCCGQVGNKGIEVCEKSSFERFGCVFVGKGPRPLVGRAPSPGGPGPKPPGDPQAPGAWIPPLSPVDLMQPRF